MEQQEQRQDHIHKAETPKAETRRNSESRDRLGQTGMVLEGWDKLGFWNQGQAGNQKAKTEIRGLTSPCF